ncbi:MAG: xanthine dehydrogenase small subunit [Lysobacterales bacterium]|nr:MAG: xanthine dehydrogenase small subunit [Xanthomonadales bacterium]
MPRPIRFLLGDTPVEVAGEDPQLTVLEWLRTRMRRTGTKEGCAEGDCGACTVAVGTLDGERIRYRAYNSCIQLLATLDGKQLVTVEDLATGLPGEERLHPVQQALVDQHGSQCGFCTPGFVMSLFTLYHEPGARAAPQDAERAVIDRALAGNLCRCTGYAPIVRAARQALAEAGADSFDRAEPETAARLRALRTDDALEFETGGRRWFAPRGLARLWDLLDQYPGARLVAGATDVGLWLTKELRQFDTLIWLGDVAELLGIGRQADGSLRIGAAVTYRDALPGLCELYPEMRALLLRLGAEQVRNAGTIGGNIANGSPIGDMPPPLIALGATLVLASRDGRRELPLEDYFIDYGRQDLRPGECVDSVRIPAPGDGLRFAVYKVSKRFDQDISALCGAFAVQVRDATVTQARVCFGGMAGTPRRAPRAEQALTGQPWTEATVTAAMAALADDYTPLTDWRASADYRRRAAQNLLRRFYLECEAGAPVQVAAGAVA